MSVDKTIYRSRCASADIVFSTSPKTKKNFTGFNPEVNPKTGTKAGLKPGSHMPRTLLLHM